MKEINNQFYIPEGTYLLNHSVGCLPKRTSLASEAFLSLWKEKGSGAWEEWLQVIDAFCHALASLLSGDKNAFCPQSNISSAIVKILYSLPSRSKRKKILLSALDFPSSGYALKQLEKVGYELYFIESTPGQNNLDNWERHLKEDVQLAFITHVFSENSYQNPVSEIVKLAQKQDIFTIVDIAQSVGVIPIDLQNWSADFVVGCSIKWLCGGPGASFLWVNLKKIGQFLPVDVGWFSHENPFEFNIHEFRYSNTALRFLGGTPSVLPLYIAKSSIELITEIGVDKIYRHNQQLLDVLLKGAHEHGIRVNSPSDPLLRGGTFVMECDTNQQGVQYFKNKLIMIDERPKFGLRFSPHVYNSRREMDEVVSVFKGLKQSNSRHL